MEGYRAHFREEEWRQISGPTGPEWLLRERPEGVGRVSYRSAGRVLWWSVEGNLTSLVHGPMATAGTLAPAEVMLGLDHLYQVAEGASHAALRARVVGPQPVPRKRHVWFSRVDASESLRVPEVLPVDRLLSGYHASVAPRATDARPVWDVRSGGRTVSVGKRGGERFIRVYDKSSEALRAGKPCPANVLRVEVERRLGSEQRTYMDEETRVIEMAEADLLEVGKHIRMVAAQFNGASCAMLRRGMVALGDRDDAAEALRLAGAVPILSEGGVDGLVGVTGVSRATAYRMRKRIEELVVAAYGKEPQNVFQRAMEEATTLLARDVALMAAEDGV